MSVITQPEIKGYWSAETRDERVANCLTRDRFFEINRCLHFVDNNIIGENNDRLRKIRPFLEKVQESFIQYVAPGTVNSVDEMMVPFKGRSCLKNYMAQKPHKWGFKFYCIADVSGYVRRFFVSGDTCHIKLDEEHKEACGISGQTVLDLTQDLPPGVDLFCDNWFASYPLLKVLKDRGINVVCTMREARTGPKGYRPEFVNDKALKKRPGRVEYKKSKDGIVICHWSDKRRVVIGSNAYSVRNEDGSMNKKERWNRESKSMEEVEVPVLISNYNQGIFILKLISYTVYSSLDLKSIIKLHTFSLGIVSYIYFCPFILNLN